jgi:hypothetical protein
LFSENKYPNTKINNVALIWHLLAFRPAIAAYLQARIQGLQLDIKNWVMFSFIYFVTVGFEISKEIWNGGSEETFPSANVKFNLK